MFILVSCDEGGTINIKNNYKEDKTVSIYTGRLDGNKLYDPVKHGEIDIPAGETGSINVERSGSLHLWYLGNAKQSGFLILRDNIIKTISLPNGGSVDVSIP